MPNRRAVYSSTLVHDFTDPSLDTRFLGDLYQELSEAARKKYALLQTPVFVEEFILDRTLLPAVETFGLATVKMIDPACGSGHFLLGGFQKLLELWRRKEPGTPPRELVQRALDAIHGVDLNPYAVATHSSLSADERRRAEEAFAGRDDCVIVATSVLELGVDVGDLHRVIQIDAPTTVSSFLQRMGRTGRRSGASRNCLFLATDDDSLLRAAGLIGLWSGGYVEPVTPPPEPYHVLAQQVMALCLQERGIGRRDWAAWVGGVPGFAAMPDAHPREVIDWMLSQGLLWEDGGLLWLGRRGEEEFGHKNFMDLFSVFTSPPLFAVRYGRQDLGFVDEASFTARREGPRVLLLGGRAWRVTHLDWPRRVAHVEPPEEAGRSRWRGTGPFVGFPLAQEIRSVLAGEDQSPLWSRRAQDKVAELREEASWVSADGPTLLGLAGGAVEWWTFAGTRANATLAGALAGRCGGRTDHDGLRVVVEGAGGLTAVEQAVRELSPAEALGPAVDEEALDGLKFSACLPKDLALAALAARLRDTAAVRAVLAQHTRVVVAG